MNVNAKIRRDSSIGAAQEGQKALTDPPCVKTWLEKVSDLSFRFNLIQVLRLKLPENVEKLLHIEFQK